MGFSTLNTLLVQMLGQVFQGVFVIIGTAGSTYFKNARTYFMAWNLAVALVGAVMIREVDPTQIWTRFMGYCLCIAFSANFPMVLSMSSGNIGGFTKKNTANAMVCYSPLMYYQYQVHRADICRSSSRIAEEI
jgi:hypothetical protein